MGKGASAAEHTFPCVTRTDRQVEIVECVLMLRCHARNMSTGDLASRQGLKWNVSQYVSLRNEDLGCTCAGTLVQCPVGARLASSRDIAGNGTGQLHFAWCSFEHE